MSMTSILTAATSLIASNFLTVTGIVLTVLFVGAMILTIRTMVQYRDFYYIFILFLLVCLYILGMISARPITSGIMWMWNWIMSKF